MTARDPAVQTFLSSVREALAARDLGPEGSARHGQDRWCADLAGTSRAWKEPAPSGLRRPPARSVRHGTAAFAGPRARRARLRGDRAGAVLGASKRKRPNASANWPDGHANATIVGPGGLESRDDVHIGVSLLARNIRYPDHNHGPEEVYFVLSPGRFRHGQSGWFEPGVGGTLYNEPDIRHAMASDGAPLFALWFLWTGKSV